MGKTPKPKRTSFKKAEVRLPVTIRKRPDNQRQPDPKRHKTVKAPRIRPSITPGAVLILLAGRHKGKRVICLKAMQSGNLLVTGPANINGVGLRRVNPRYVIATSTKVPVQGVNVEAYNDSLFPKHKRSKTKKPKESEDVFMSQGKAPTQRKTNPELVKAQQEADAPILAFLNEPKNALLKQYLRTKFTLGDRMYPHRMKF